jgi:undecaprenyl-diphosphatase
MARSKLTLALILIGVFAILSYLAHLNVFNSFDYTSMVFLQKILPSVVDVPFAILSYTGSTEITALALAVFAVIFFKYKKKIPYALLIFGLIFVIEIGGKLYIEQERPPLSLQKSVFPFTLPSATVPFPYAFPSGHMARIWFVCVVYLGLFARGTHKDKKRNLVLATGIYLFVMIISRIYLGAHWFSDVLGGSILGAGLGLITNYTLYAHYNRKNIAGN